MDQQVKQSVHFKFDESAFSALSHLSSSSDCELSYHNRTGFGSGSEDEIFTQPEVAISDLGEDVSSDDRLNYLCNVSRESSLDKATSQFGSAVEPTLGLKPHSAQTKPIRYRHNAKKKFLRTVTTSDLPSFEQAMNATPREKKSIES